MKYEKKEKTVKAFQWAWDVRRRILEPGDRLGMPVSPLKGTPCDLPPWFLDRLLVHYKNGSDSFKNYCENPLFYHRINYGQDSESGRCVAESGSFYLKTGKDHPIKRGDVIVKEEGDNYEVLPEGRFLASYTQGATLITGDILCIKKAEIVDAFQWEISAVASDFKDEEEVFEHCPSWFAESGAFGFDDVFTVYTPDGVKKLEDGVKSWITLNPYEEINLVDPEIFAKDFRPL